MNNLVEMEPGLATVMSGGPMERADAQPAVMIELLGDDFIAIERDPKPSAVIAVEGGAAAAAVLQRLTGAPEAGEGQDGEQFTAYEPVVGDPAEIFGGIKVVDGDAEQAGAFIRKLIGAVERPGDGEPEASLGEQGSIFESEEQSASRGLGHEALQSVRRSRLGMYVATAVTTAGAFFAAHTESAKATTPLVNPIFRFGDSIHYLDDSTSPVPTGPVPGEPTDPGSGGDTSPSGGGSSSGSETAPTDPAELKKDCVDVALQKPKVTNAEVLHAGNFDVEKGHTQSWALSLKYRESMPDYCQGLYGRGNKAKAQAFHNGHWVNEGEWNAVTIIPQDNEGSWVDIGNTKQVEFPVCRARILLKATSADLTKNTGKSWAAHPVIASRTFPPIPVKKILPHKPKGC